MSASTAAACTPAAGRGRPPQALSGRRRPLYYSILWEGTAALLQRWHATAAALHSFGTTIIAR
jgi:hypothetical protein